MLDDSLCGRGKRRSGRVQPGVGNPSPLGLANQDSRGGIAEGQVKRPDREVVQVTAEARTAGGLQWGKADDDYLWHCLDLSYRRIISIGSSTRARIAASPAICRVSVLTKSNFPRAISEFDRCMPIFVSQCLPQCESGGTLDGVRLRV